MSLKKTLCFVFSLLLSLAASAQKGTIERGAKVLHTSAKTTSPRRPTEKRASVKFAVEKIDFGTVKEDAIIEKKFEFTNIGASDLVVISAKGSCGCTIPTVPAEPIPPGAKGFVAVKYIARNKVGPQKPEITVVTNGVPSVVKVHLEGWVDQIPGGVKEK